MANSYTTASNCYNYNGLVLVTYVDDKNVEKADPVVFTGILNKVYPYEVRPVVKGRFAQIQKHIRKFYVLRDVVKDLIDKGTVTHVIFTDFSDLLINGSATDIKECLDRFDSDLVISVDSIFCFQHLKTKSLFDTIGGKYTKIYANQGIFGGKIIPLLNLLDDCVKMFDKGLYKEEGIIYSEQTMLGAYLYENHTKVKIHFDYEEELFYNMCITEDYDVIKKNPKHLTVQHNKIVIGSKIPLLIHFPFLRGYQRLGHQSLDAFDTVMIEMLGDGYINGDLLSNEVRERLYARKQREKDEDLKFIGRSLIRVFRSPETDARRLVVACGVFLKLFGVGK